MIDRIARLYEKYAWIVSFLAPVALLAIRLAWGWELAQSGWGHLTHLDKTTDFFASLNIPMPRASAMISGTTELVGGCLWMLGLATRLISIPLFFNFCVAYWTASHDKVVNFFQKNGVSNFIDDSAFPFLVTSLLLIAFGAGAISIDGIIKRACRKRD